MGRLVISSVEVVVAAVRSSADVPEGWLLRILTEIVEPGGRRQFSHGLLFSL
jgi:hypothetical protein